MRTATIAASAALVIGLVMLSAWLLQWSLEKAALLAPVIVATVGATVFIGALWAKIVWDALRQARHPVLVVAGAIGAIVVLVVLSFFVELPGYH
jgi:predicted N-acetyltransferase YhbS